MEDLTQDSLIATGAEARIWKGRWVNRDVVIKERVVKGYRHPVLDEGLRQTRTRKEARLLRDARKAGVPTPIIYDVIPWEYKLVIQWFDGSRVMDCIEEGVHVDLKQVGEYIGLLHRADISHGDLTTSNILYSPETERFVLIDFSLGEFGASVEEKGVDLHLLREAMISVHEDPIDKYDEVLEGYLETYPQGEVVIQRTKEIEGRGRYQ